MEMKVMPAGKRQGLWQVALNRANVALSGEGLLSVINPCHIPICYSPIFNFLVDKQQTMYTCSMYSGLKATHWRRGGRGEGEGARGGSLLLT